MSDMTTEPARDASDFGEWFRETTSGTTKTALLMLAVLLITELSGIEPTYQRMEKTRRALRDNNRERQHLERRVQKEALFIADVERRRKAPHDVTPTEQVALKKSPALETKESDLRTSDEVRQLAIAHGVEAERDRLPHDVDVADQMSKEAASTANSIAEQRKKLGDDLASLKEKSEVAFDLLGQKLALPPLAACFLWTLLVIGLFRYLAVQRRIVIRATHDEIARSSSDAVRNTIRSAVESWLAPVPATLAPETGSRPIVDAYNWLGSYLPIGVGVILSIALIVATNGVVLWRALDLAHDFGRTLVVAFMIPSVTALFLVVVWSAATMLSGDSLFEDQSLSLFVVAGIVFSSAVVFFLLNARLASRAAAKLSAWMPVIIALSIIFIVAIGLEMLLVTSSSTVLAARRRAIRATVVALAGVALLTVSGPLIRASRRKRLRKVRRRRRRRPEHMTLKTKVRDGFYQNRRSEVIYYVAGGKTHGRVRESNLISIGLTAPPWRDVFPLREHVHLACASVMMEQPALRFLASNQERDVNIACALLVNAIQHDLYFKRQRSGKISVRLWDLLAGVAVRHHLPEYTVALGQLIEANKLEPYLKDRMRRWSDPSSAWHLRWSRRDKPIRWNGVMLS